MNIKQKFLIFLNLLIIPFFSHALPENAPKIGSIVIGAVTGVIAVGNQNPLLLIPALCATAATYKYLQRFTPTYRLNLAKDILKEIVKDPLASDSFSFKSKNFFYKDTQISKDDFLEVINSQECYQHNLPEIDHTILIARNILISFRPQLQAARALIDKAKYDLKDEDIQPGSFYSTLDEQNTLYSKNITSAIGCIMACNPEYQQALEYYNSKSTKDKELALQKELNQIKQTIAHAQQQQAFATTQQAQAAKSYTTLEYVKYIIYLLTGWGKPA